MYKAAQVDIAGIRPKDNLAQRDNKSVPLLDGDPEQEPAVVLLLGLFLTVPSTVCSSPHTPHPDTPLHSSQLQHNVAP